MLNNGVINDGLTDNYTIVRLISLDPYQMATRTQEPIQAF